MQILTDILRGLAFLVTLFAAGFASGWFWLPPSEELDRNVTALFGATALIIFIFVIAFAIGLKRG